MAILKVARLGHPVLRQVAATVPGGEIASPRIQGLIADMIDTCREYDGAGLAAPQVHVSLRIALLEVHGNPRYPGVRDFDLTVMINPVITPLTEDVMHVWEGCLSVPDFRGLVPRRRRVRVTAL